MNKEEKIPSFIQIPYKVLSDKKLQPLDVLLYGFIYWYAHLKLEKCIASNKTIADSLKTTRQCVANSLTRLEAQKHIKRIFKDKAKKKRLEVVPLTPLDDGRKRKIPWDELVKVWASDNCKDVSEFWKDRDNITNAIDKYISR